MIMSGMRRRSRGNRLIGRSVRTMCEVLEERRLLSGVPPVAEADTYLTPVGVQLSVAARRCPDE